MIIKRGFVCLVALDKSRLVKMIGELGKDFAVEGTNLYDLGCSTGNSLLSSKKFSNDDFSNSRTSKQANP